MSKFISKQSVASLVCIDCPPSYLSSRASDPLVFPRWE